MTVMAEGSAKQDIQVAVGKDFVIMGTDRVEVSPDGKKVTAYTNLARRTMPPPKLQRMKSAL
jgi:hypothetical protein